MSKNRTCICCNTKYEYCPTCWEDRFKEPWHTEFCCEDCKNLWETATKFNMELITKEKAQKDISALNLKPRAEYAECVQRDLKNILDEEPKAPKMAKPIREVVSEEKNK